MRTLVTACLALAVLSSIPATAAEADPKALEIATRVMDRLGGQGAWEATRYLTWNFFGQRRHLWDKHTGRIRVEGRDRDSGEAYLILMGLDDKQGRAWRDGTEITAPDELAAMLDRGEAAWINDSYWLVMPYKLRDPGVTLRHAGEAEMLDGRAAEVLELTFDGVGRTPENRYLVYVASDTGLVEQWDFFRDAADTEPGFQIPWHDWRRHGAILLSADRGERGHTDVAVLEAVPESAFTSPEPIDWAELIATAGSGGTAE